MQDGTRLSLLQAQLDEIEALQACYPDGELSFTAAEATALRFAAAVVAGPAAAELHDVPALSATLRLPGVELAGQPVQLKFTLPRGSSGEPGLQVLCNASRPAADVLQAAASSTAGECARDGTPCLLLVSARLAEAARQLAEAEAAERQQAAQQPPGSVGDATGQAGGRQELRQGVLSRRCVWFHHIKNLNKRKSIVAWGNELGLGGYSKPGFPGVLLVEVRGSEQQSLPRHWPPAAQVAVRAGASTQALSFCARIRSSAAGCGQRRGRVPAAAAAPALAGHGCEGGGGRGGCQPAGGHPLCDSWVKGPAVLPRFTNTCPC
jgi:hypothetical protein